MKQQQNKPLKEKDLLDLTMEKREPVTEAEKSLQKQIKEIKEKGRIVEIPKDFL